VTEDVTPPRSSPALDQRLRAAETEWLEETTPDAVSFEMFKGYPPKPMRRHRTIVGGLAELVFGGNENPEGMWLGMIVSENPGSGHALIERIKQIADKYDLSIEGVVNPLKPSNWDPARKFVPLGRLLAPYYVKRGFEIIGGDAACPRVRYRRPQQAG
jgi:hypothetical protein